MPSSQHTTKPVMLYVDDDEEDRLLLADALSDVAPGYVIETLSDGTHALQYLIESKEHLPCLVIVDLNMPGMNGKELIKILREEHQLHTLPIVAFTTSANPVDKIECRKYGVDMITKPITFNELKETVKILLSYCNATV